jgi:tRNA dimethylallyltransferase
LISDFPILHSEFLIYYALYYIYSNGLSQQLLTVNNAKWQDQNVKSRLAFNLADHIGAEIISIDSMKVYRRMDIGTAKPPKEARAAIRHHLIDIVEPSDSYGVGLFLEHAAAAIRKIKRRNSPVVAVGGTALYIKALLYGLFEGPGADESIRKKKLQKGARAKGLMPLHRQLEAVDPITAERIHPNDAKRIIRALEVYELTGMPISSLQQQWKREMNHDWVIIGLRRERDAANRRINSRVKKMIACGLVDEVKSLLAEDKPLSKQARCAIGYAEIIDHLKGKMSLQDATELIKKNTRRLAKNQRTWFRSFKNIRWLDIQPEEPLERTLTRAIAPFNRIR